MYLHLLKYYAEVLRWERLDVDTTRRLQVAKFRRIFDHACAHSKFYRELYGDAGVLGLSIRSMEDIERIPVIDKQSIRSLPAEDILTVPLTSGDLCTHKTSGSTGEPMTLYSSKREYHTSNVRAFRSLRRCGYTPLRSLATVFRGEPGSSVSVEREFGLLSFLQSRLGLFRRTSISSFEPVEQIIDVLQSTRTDLL